MDLLPNITQAESLDVAAALVGLLNGLLATEKNATGKAHAEAASLEAMKAFIIRNLHDPELSATTLTKTFHCSRAKIYRIFAEEDGVASFIRKRRLMGCYDDLSRSHKKPGAVQEVAERWGFLDPFHFSRLFKRAYGVAPSDILGSGPPTSPRQETTSDENGGVMHNWVRNAIEASRQKEEK